MQVLSRPYDAQLLRVLEDAHIIPRATLDWVVACVKWPLMGFVLSYVSCTGQLVPAAVYSSGSSTAKDSRGQRPRFRMRDGCCIPRIDAD